MAFDPKKLEEARQKAASKKSVDETRNEPGLQDISLTPITKPDLEKVGAASQKEYEQMGHPTIGKLVNVGVSNLPEIASLGAGAGTEAAGEVADVALAPSIQAGGKALGAAEKAAKIATEPFLAKDLPRSAAQAIDFSKYMGDMLKHTPEEIVQAMEPAGINNLRKVIEYTLDTFKTKLPGPNVAAISKAKDLLTKAVDLAEPTVATSREALRNSYARKNILGGVAKGAATIGAYEAGKHLITKGL